MQKENQAAKYIDVDGVRTCYFDSGSGRPLVLVHGGGAGADAWGNWKSCIPLYEKNFRVIAVDMIGFGNTDKPPSDLYAYDQAGRNRHMAGFLEALAIGPVNIIGSSMGGATVLGVAMAKPQLIEKMVLMGSAGIDISNPDPAYKQTMAKYDFTREGMREIMKALSGSRSVVDEELLEYRFQLSIRDDVKMALGAIRGKPLIYAENEIGAIKHPTLVVAGKEDRVAILDRNYRFLELLENSWGFIMPHCGHWVMIERPAEFVEITSKFFRSDIFH